MKPHPAIGEEPCMSTFPFGGTAARPLHRSNRHRVIAGVCGGIADWLGWDATLVRGMYVVASLLSAAFPGTLVYLILWIVMPRARD